MVIIATIFGWFAELIQALSKTVIYNNGGIQFTLLSLTLTIFVINALIDIAMFFIQPKKRIAKGVKGQYNSFRAWNISRHDTYKLKDRMYKVK